ncbi:DUF6285 domain-containing protein [Mycobacterium sp. HM-7]
MSHYRPTAAELVAAVAEFLETEVRAATDGAVNFHARVAANALRIVERELQQDSSDPSLLGFTDEQGLAAAIRLGDFDDRGPELESALRSLVRHRLDVDHPRYEQE